MANKYNKLKTFIPAGKSEADPIYTQGLRLGFIGIPKGMTGISLTLQCSFDGIDFFVLNGIPGGLSFNTRTDLTPSTAQHPGEPYSIWAVNQSVNLEGIQMFRAVSNQKETETREINFYLVNP